MGPDQFEDLFMRGDLLPDSSQESRTNAATNLSFGSTDSCEASLSVILVGFGTKMTGLSDGDLSENRPRSLDVGDKPSLEPSEIPALFEDELKVAKQTNALDPRDQIESAFESIVDAMLNEKNEISVTLKIRPTALKSLTAGEVTPGFDEAKYKRICFPGKTEREAWRFAMILRLLELIHEALSTGIVLSKRDMYYRDPALFGSQTHVDKYVDDIAYTFGVPRSALNVTAVAKGLVVGAISFCRRDGSTVSALGDREGILVPNLKDVLSVDMSNVKWIIVVEKEASFRSITTSSFWNTLATEGVLITGKGYPDIASRALLHFFTTPSPQNGFASPLVFGLADFDPDGLAILSVYKHGSIALAHESADQRVPKLRWLGLRSKHVMMGGDSLHASQGLLSLTVRDRKKARQMMEHAQAQQQIAEAEAEWCRELQVMLMLNVKAELQLLDAVPDSMTDLLGEALGES